MFVPHGFQDYGYPRSLTKYSVKSQELSSHSTWVTVSSDLTLPLVSVGASSLRHLQV